MERYESLIIKESIIPLAYAYWISPIGKILPITDKFGQGKHIDSIIENPKAFGLTVDEVQAMYDVEGETMGIEGRAREKLIKQLINQGWIRIRRYLKPEMWTININRITPKIKKILYSFAKTMVDQHKIKYDDVKIDMINKVIRTSFNDIVNESLLNENIDDGFELIVCKTVDDLL